MQSTMLKAVRSILLAASIGMSATHALAQSCVTGSFVVNGVPQPFSGPSGSGSTPGGFGLASYSYSSYGETAQMSLSFRGSASFTLERTYKFLGKPAGTPVSQVITFGCYGYGSSYSGDGNCASNGASASFKLDGGTVAQASGHGQFDSFGCSSGGFNTSTTIQITRPAGTPFTLTSSMGCTASDIGSGTSSQSVRFMNITPGAFLVRCDGTRVSQVVVGVDESMAGGLSISPVWPNPSHGVFQANVNVPLGAPAFLRVFDVSGRVVHARPVDAGHGPRGIAVDAKLAPGTYFLHLQQGTQTAVRQVVIEE